MSNDDSTDDSAKQTVGKPRGRPFVSGDPRAATGKQITGRPKGSRHSLSETFLKALVEDFTAELKEGETNGMSAIKKCREGDPVNYVRICASLLPKQIDVNPVKELTDEQLVERLTDLRAAYRAAVAGGASEAGGRIVEADEDEVAPKLQALH